jgi:hypothetical protein
VPVRHRVHGDCRISTKRAEKGDSSECQRVERPVVGTTWTALYAFYVRLLYYVSLPLAFDANLLTSMPPLLVVVCPALGNLREKKGMMRNWPTRQHLIFRRLLQLRELDGFGQEHINARSLRLLLRLRACQTGQSDDI